MNSELCSILMLIEVRIVGSFMEIIRNQGFLLLQMIHI